MSREIRRVPVDWKHPTEPNPHWEFQEANRIHRGRPPSRLTKPGEQFRSLMSPSLSAQQREWDEGLAKWLEGTHESFDFHLRYHHKDGFIGRDGERSFNPFRVYADDEETVLREWFVESADDLKSEDAYIAATWARPSDDDADQYMPDFDVPEEELGWCLYQTVSEGTPTTPVFATPEELIEHLATVGQDYDQEPMRRSAAEVLVRSGSSLGSMLSVGSRLYQSDKDADLIAELPKSSS